MSECKCSMSISVLGDGCRYCQPQEYIDSLEILHKENDELLETCADLERQLEEAREAMCIYVREHSCEGIQNDDDAVIYFKNTFNEKNYN